MDHSMDEGDSLLSTPGIPRQQNQQSITAPNQPYSSHGPDDSSYEYEPNTSGAFDEEPTQEEEEIGEDEDQLNGEGDDALSEGSSADYDRYNDPEGYAKRLDGLAGVLEMREDEARAMKWGPDLRRDKEEWKYTKPDYTTLPGRPGMHQQGAGLGPMEESWETHPIRVISPDWTGRRIASQLESMELDDGGRGGMNGSGMDVDTVALR